MITKIDRLKDFGIFKNFTWNTSNTNEFCKKNLIYGWNYSGKTTCSRIFKNLEKRRKLYFPAGQFILTADTKSYTQEDLVSFPYSVKVFNCDYIKTVFAWDKELNDGFNPISFYLGDDAGDIQPKIDSLRERWNKKINLIKEKNKQIVDDFDEYKKDNGRFSKQATEIRKYLGDRIKSSEFNKGHFTVYVERIKNNANNYLLDQKSLDSLKRQATSENDCIEQGTSFNVLNNLNSLGEEIKLILEGMAPQSVSFPELDESKELFSWVQDGLALHASSKKCKFCEQNLTIERIESLNRYYSKKLFEIQNAIKTIKGKIENEIKDINVNFPHKSNIASHLQNSYEGAIVEFDEKKQEYIEVLKVFLGDIRKKENSFFTALMPTIFSEVKLSDSLSKVVDIIKIHNVFVQNFESNKKSALEAVLQHYIAEYLLEQNYVEKEKNANKAGDICYRCGIRVKENDKEILRLEGKLKDTIKGQVEINKYLKVFLNRDDIKIGVLKDRFVLLRGDYPASDLSEGEKAALAFAYFLTELKSLKKEKRLKNTIIFIDDPISSLDSNHIFQVRSLIQDFFDHEDDYLQLFISTHNFDFFSVLLDSNLFKNKNKKNIKTTKMPFYLINRINKDTSVIKNLPQSLRSHKSEYAHIFNILKDYDDLAEKEDFEFAILLPNALRRFLELYTLFKFPKGYCEIDERMRKVFAEEDSPYHKTKLYHWFSHQQQFEKVAQHDSKLMLIDDAISEVLAHIRKNDRLHWEGLTGES